MNDNIIFERNYYLPRIRSNQNTKIMKTLAEKLRNEIESLDQNEPNVQVFVDNKSIFWVSKDGHFVWMADHQGIAEYIDANHQVSEEKTPEGVGAEGVYWNNLDFESPFHVSDFIEKIETINV